MDSDVEQARRLFDHKSRKHCVVPNSGEVASASIGWSSGGIRGQEFAGSCGRALTSLGNLPDQVATPQALALTYNQGTRISLRLAAQPAVSEELLKPATPLRSESYVCQRRFGILMLHCLF